MAVNAASAGLALLAALGLAAGAASQTPAGGEMRRAIAANGAVVEMPDPAGLDCVAMAQVLRDIDRSHYRGLDPVPADHPDRPIFDYENRLSSAYYHGCTLGEHQFEDPSTAFSFGFGSQ